MKQKQSILFLSRLYHPHVGGVENHVKILAQMLLAKGFKVTIITEKFDKTLPDFERLKGVDIYRVPIGNTAFMKKFFIWKWVLYHLAIIMKADVIHVHDVFYWILPFRLFLLGKKIYTTFHGYEGYPVRTAWILQRKVTEKLSKGTICVGDFMKKWYKSSPTVVSYGGVRLAHKNKTINSQTAVFFGRFDRQTGILQYLKAYKLIKEKYPKFTLTLVGDGELLHKIPKNIKIVGFTDDVDSFIAKNRFIFVSRYLSMLEALIAEKEVIAVYDNPIKRDYLVMSPFKKYVHVASNASEIADYVIKSLKEGPDEKMMRAGYEWAGKNSWDKILDLYLRLWGIKLTPK